MAVYVNAVYAGTEAGTMAQSFDTIIKAGYAPTGPGGSYPKRSVWTAR